MKRERERSHESTVVNSNPRLTTASVQILLLNKFQVDLSTVESVKDIVRKSEDLIVLVQVKYELFLFCSIRIHRLFKLRVFYIVGDNQSS